MGWSVVPLEEGTGLPGIGNDRIRPYQPWMPELHSFRVGGTGIAGLAFADDTSGSFPQEWRDVALLANPITSSISAVRVNRNADGSVTAAHLPDLLNAEDNWFRPVDFANAPDGTLYIADMYRETIEHPWSIPPNIKQFLDLNSGNDRGRVYRIVPDGFRRPEPPRLDQAETSELVATLEHANGWHRETAQRLLFERQDKAAVAPLVKPSGSLVLVAECPEGIGDLEIVNEKIFRIGVLPRLAPGVRLHLVSALANPHVTLLEPLDSLAEVVQRTGSLLVIPRASQMLFS
jgi:hypothetical protein